VSDDNVRLSLIGQILRRRWRLLAVIALLGALVGAGASILFSPGYQASSRVLLQGPREPAELLTEAQVAMSTTVLDRTAATLGWNVSGVDLQSSVTAEVANGNVIDISGTADTAEKAKQLADQVAEEYVRFAAQLSSNTADASAQVFQEQRETLRRLVAETGDRITQLHDAATKGVTVESVQVRTELEGLRTTLSQAIAKLDEADSASSRAHLVVMGPAELPNGPAAPTLTQLVIGGFVLFFVLGVFGHMVAARGDRRLRNEPEIAAALGTTTLSSVDVLDVPPAAAPAGRRSIMRWLLQSDAPWNTPALPVSDDLARGARYRRVLPRIRGESGEPLHLMVLVAGDDPDAYAAVARLAVAACADGPTSVLTDRTDFADLVAGTDGDPAARERLTILPDTDPEPVTSRTTLRVVTVAAGRPTVPGDRDLDGAIVVLTTGTRTAWELVGIAEACGEAGLDVLGAVVAHRARPLPENEPKPAVVDDEPAAAMAGWS
jgi:hypothetical protein